MHAFTRRNTLFALFGLLSALVVAPPAQAQAPPSTMPLVINKPGSYVLNRDILVNDGDAVTISASGVTLDLNGRNIGVATAGKGRGVVVMNAKGVTVKNGKIGAFNINVFAMNSQNVTLKELQIVGENLAPLGADGGPPPAEIGILLVNCRGANVTKNTVTAVNLGLFIRGPLSRGNRIVENQFVGGAEAARNLLGMCWNPTTGDPNLPSDTPQGDFVYKNQISQYQTGISFVSGSRGNVVKENAIQYITRAFSPVTNMTENVIEENALIQVLP